MPIKRSSPHGSERLAKLVTRSPGTLMPSTSERDHGNALYAASAGGHLETAKLLLEKGADINAQGGEYGNALQAASARGHLEIAKLLLEKGADINTQYGKFGNALYAASAAGNLETAGLLLKRGANINAQGGKYGNALQAALAGGHQEIAKLLLEKGADVNAQGGEYSNALHAALAGGHQEIAKLLLEKGADINAQYGKFGDALYAASAAGNLETAGLLLKRGANINAQGGKYGNALQAASVRGHLEIAKLLLKRGADVNAQGGECGNALQAALARGHLEIAKLLLEKGADVNAQDGTHGNGPDLNSPWISELKEIGYSHNEITQLLDEMAKDSPWIYFEPVNISFGDMKSDHHIPGCVHELDSSSRQYNFNPYLAIQPDRDRKVTRLVEQLCGIGGIIPTSRDTTQWNGTAEFNEENSAVSIRYLSASDTSSSIPSLISRLLRVAENFSTAVHKVQDLELCCDSFTVLAVQPTSLNSLFPETRMHRIGFSSARALLNSLKFLSIHNEGDLLWVQELEMLRATSQSIISIIDLIDSPNPLKANNWEDIFHMASLTLQFLTLGFLAYIQAHDGMLQPFFLDTPLQSIQLLGTRAIPAAGSSLTLRLIQLICFSGVSQGPVLVFDAPDSTLVTSSLQKYDIRVSPIDLLDTWGPGELVSQSESKDLPFAIRIGGGYISPPSDGNDGEKYHWDQCIRFPQKPHHLNLTQEILIGDMVQQNLRCIADEQRNWNASSRQFEELGTYDSYFELAEQQFGLQGGIDNLAMTAHQVWAKRRGKIIKETNLSQTDILLIPFLDSYWGVRVSFCTGVAQRVSLRHLVSELLPAFAPILRNPLTRGFWADLDTTHGIIDRLRNTDPPGSSLSDWFTTLPENLYQFALFMIRQILECLKQTGISSDGRHFSVAWPYNGIINRCFQMPLGSQNKWTPILADSKDVRHSHMYQIRA
ncbi:Ankyrin repeat domain-containing protein [Paramyrothecium foliicola]|nr:Ankyrin repeat domain-containing protein [Paramyrothecium foliicola]